MTITMVMGASVGAKLVMVCGAPSSNTLKFSFFRPVRMSPFSVVAMTSRVTTGTSTAMVTPASGGACVGGLAGGFCCGTGGGALCWGWPPCGPAGACAKAGGRASAQVIKAAVAAVTIVEDMLFMRDPLFLRGERSFEYTAMRLNLRNVGARSGQRRDTCML